MSITANARVYYFACEFLWCSLSLHHYLAEMVAAKAFDLRFARLEPPLEDLAEWALQERHFPVDAEEPMPEEAAALFSATDSLRDPLIVAWSNELQTASRTAYQRYPFVPDRMWLHYYYCAFLQRILDEFDQLVREIDGVNSFYHQKEDSVVLFNRLRSACRTEQTTIAEGDADGRVAIDQLLTEMEALAVRLGANWRQAVVNASRVSSGR